MVDFFQVLLFILPSYIANSSPVVLGGGMALDFGARFVDKRRLFGPSKTLRGFIGGIAAGTVAGGVLALFYPLPYFASPQQQFVASFLLALGTLVGDALGSFIKRRLRMAPGKPFLLDSVLFLIVALVLAYPVTSPSIYTSAPLVFLAALTLVLHPSTNWLANKLGMKKVPW